MISLSVLDTLIQVFAWSIIAAPIIVLTAAGLIYHYKPNLRKALGIILVSLGSFGALIFIFDIYIFSIKDSSIGLLFVFTTFSLIELATIALGILSLKRHHNNV